MDFFTGVLRDLVTILSTTGDGLLPAGLYERQRDGNHIWAVNRNNHQLTWGVLSSSLLALSSFLRAYRVYGNVMCNIYDGVNWVGSGSLTMG